MKHHVVYLAHCYKLNKSYIGYKGFNTLRQWKNYNTSSSIKEFVNNKPLKTILYYFDNKEEALAKESEIIEKLNCVEDSFFLNKVNYLKNGLRSYWTKENKKKMSEKIKSKYKDNPEIVERQKKSKSKYYKDENWLKSIRELRAEVANREELKEKARERAIKQFSSPESREKLRNRAKKMWKSDSFRLEYRKNNSPQTLVPYIWSNDKGEVISRSVYSLKKQLELSYTSNIMRAIRNPGRKVKGWKLEI